MNEETSPITGSKVKMDKEGRFTIDGRLAKVWAFYRHGHGWDVGMESEDQNKVTSIHTQPGLTKLVVERLIATGAAQKAWAPVKN